MRSILLAVLLSIALPTFLTSGAVAKDAPPESESGLLQKAAEGDDAAKLQLGKFYCRHEEPKAYNAKALKWWNDAASGKDPAQSGAAEEELGNFWLSLYPPESPAAEAVTAYNYDPAKENAAERYCTGSQHSAANDEKAAEHFKRCITFADNYAPTGCQLGLGHLYFAEKKFDEAYFWYAFLIADEITTSKSNSTSSYTPIDYDGPLLGAKEKLPQEWQQSVAGYTALAAAAAKHLTPEQIAAADKKARALLAGQDQAAQDLPPPE